eukprot:gene1311-1899_t
MTGLLRWAPPPPLGAANSERRGLIEGVGLSGEGFDPVAAAAQAEPLLGEKPSAREDPADAHRRWAGLTPVISGTGDGVADTEGSTPLVAGESQVPADAAEDLDFRGEPLLFYERWYGEFYELHRMYDNFYDFGSEGRPAEVDSEVSVCIIGSTPRVAPSTGGTNVTLHLAGQLMYHQLPRIGCKVGDQTLQASSMTISGAREISVVCASPPAPDSVEASAVAVRLSVDDHVYTYDGPALYYHAPYAIRAADADVAFEAHPQWEGFRVSMPLAPTSGSRRTLFPPFVYAMDEDLMADAACLIQCEHRCKVQGDRWIHGELLLHEDRVVCYLPLDEAEEEQLVRVALDGQTASGDGLWLRYNDETRDLVMFHHARGPLPESTGRAAHDLPIEYLPFSPDLCVNVQPSAKGGLAALELSAGTLSPDFSSTWYEYHVVLERSEVRESRVTVTATAAATGASLAIAGRVAPSGAPVEVVVRAGETTVELRVATPSGGIFTYILAFYVVNELLPPGSLVLMVPSVGVLDPAFDAAYPGPYTLALGSGTEEVSFRAAAFNDAAVMVCVTNEAAASPRCTSAASGAWSEARLPLGSTLVELAVDDDLADGPTYEVVVLRGNAAGLDLQAHDTARTSRQLLEYEPQPKPGDLPAAWMAPHGAVQVRVQWPKPPPPLRALILWLSFHVARRVLQASPPLPIPQLQALVIGQARAGASAAETMAVIQAFLEPATAPQYRAASLLQDGGRHVELVSLKPGGTYASPLDDLQMMPQSVEQVYANLEPSIGDVDLGRRWGLQFPAAAHGEVVAVEVRVNSGAGALLEYELEVYVEAEHLQVLGCVQGRDWAGEWACTINAPPGVVLVSGQTPRIPAQGNSLSVATLDLAANSDVYLTHVDGMVFKFLLSGNTGNSSGYGFRAGAGQALFHSPSSQAAAQRLVPRRSVAETSLSDGMFQSLFKHAALGDRENTEVGTQRVGSGAGEERGAEAQASAHDSAQAVLDLPLVTATATVADGNAQPPSNTTSLLPSVSTALGVLPSISTALGGQPVFYSGAWYEWSPTFYELPFFYTPWYDTYFSDFYTGFYEELFTGGSAEVPDSMSICIVGMSPVMGHDLGGSLVTLHISGQLAADWAPSIACRFGAEVVAASSVVAGSGGSSTLVGCVAPPRPAHAPRSVTVRLTLDGERYSYDGPAFHYHAPFSLARRVHAVHVTGHHFDGFEVTIPLVPATADTPFADIFPPLLAATATEGELPALCTLGDRHKLGELSLRWGHVLCSFSAAELEEEQSLRVSLDGQYLSQDAIWLRHWPAERRLEAWRRVDLPQEPAADPVGAAEVFPAEYLPFSPDLCVQFGVPDSAALEALDLHQGQLFPAFDPEVHDYTVVLEGSDLPEDLSMVIAPRAVGQGATMRVLGEPVSNGKPLRRQLRIGENHVPIEVTSTSQSKRGTYQLTVYVLTSLLPEGSLTGVSPSAGLLEPGFDPQTTGPYSLLVPAHIGVVAFKLTSLRGEPISCCASAKPRLDACHVTASGDWSSEISLQAGINLVELQPTAGDRVYEVLVLQSDAAAGSTRAALSPTLAASVTASGAPAGWNGTAWADNNLTIVAPEGPHTAGASEGRFPWVTEDVQDDLPKVAVPTMALRSEADSGMRNSVSWGSDVMPAARYPVLAAVAQYPTITAAGDAASSAPIGLASRTELAVVLHLDDGSSRDVTHDRRHARYELGEGAERAELRGSSVAGVAPGLVTVRVTWTNHSAGVELVATHGIAEMMVVLTDGRRLDVTAQAVFSSDNASAVTVSGAMLKPVAAGEAVIAGVFGNSTWGAVTVQAGGEVSVVHVEARTVWWEGRTFLGEWGASKRLAVRVVFDDGTELPDAVGGAEWISTPQLLRFESGVEAAVAVDAHGVATLLGNHHRAVELTVTAACPEAEGLQMPQSVEQVRVNSGAGALLEYELEVYVEAEHLQVLGPNATVGAVLCRFGTEDVPASVLEAAAETEIGNVDIECAAPAKAHHGPSTVAVQLSIDQGLSFTTEGPPLHYHSSFSITAPDTPVPTATGFLVQFSLATAAGVPLLPRHLELRAGSLRSSPGCLILGSDQIVRGEFSASNHSVTCHLLQDSLGARQEIHVTLDGNRMSDNGLLVTYDAEGSALVVGPESFPSREPAIAEDIRAATWPELDDAEVMPFSPGSCVQGPSPNTLTALDLSWGHLHPPFDPNTYTYYVAVPREVAAWLTLSPSTNAFGADLEVAGSPAASGEPAPLELQLGYNRVDAAVTSATTRHEVHYTVVVDVLCRLADNLTGEADARHTTLDLAGRHPVAAASEENGSSAGKDDWDEDGDVVSTKLSVLELSIGELRPAFHPDMHAYDAILDEREGAAFAVGLRARPAERRAVVRVDGDTLAGGRFSRRRLSPGTNTLEVQVTSSQLQNVSSTYTVQVYVLTEHLAAGSLTEIAASAGRLEPEFSTLFPGPYLLHLPDPRAQGPSAPPAPGVTLSATSLSQAPVRVCGGKEALVGECEVLASGASSSGIRLQDGVHQLELQVLDTNLSYKAARSDPAGDASLATRAAALSARAEAELPIRAEGKLPGRAESVVPGRGDSRLLAEGALVGVLWPSVEAEEVAGPLQVPVPGERLTTYLEKEAALLRKDAQKSAQSADTSGDGASWRGVGQNLAAPAVWDPLTEPRSTDDESFYDFYPSAELPFFYSRFYGPRDDFYTHFYLSTLSLQSPGRHVAAPDLSTCILGSSPITGPVEGGTRVTLVVSGHVLPTMDVWCRFGARGVRAKRVGFPSSAETAIECGAPPSPAQPGGASQPSTVAVRLSLDGGVTYTHDGAPFHYHAALQLERVRSGPEGTGVAAGQRVEVQLGNRDAPAASLFAPHVYALPGDLGVRPACLLTCLQRCRARAGEWWVPGSFSLEEGQITCALPAAMLEEELQVRVSLDGQTASHSGAWLDFQHAADVGEDTVAPSRWSTGLAPPHQPYATAVTEAVFEYLPFSPDYCVHFAIKQAAALDDLRLSEGELRPFFDPRVYEYYVLVAPEAMSHFAVTPVAATWGATVAVDGQSVPSGTRQHVALRVGENSIVVAVTSEDAMLTWQYVLTVYVLAPDLADGVLTQLELSHGALEPPFDPAHAGPYSGMVEADAQVVSVRPTSLAGLPATVCPAAPSRVGECVTVKSSHWSPGLYARPGPTEVQVSPKPGGMVYTLIIFRHADAEPSAWERAAAGSHGRHLLAPPAPEPAQQNAATHPSPPMSKQRMRRLQTLGATAGALGMPPHALWWSPSAASSHRRADHDEGGAAGDSDAPQRRRTGLPLGWPRSPPSAPAALKAEAYPVATPRLPVSISVATQFPRIAVVGDAATRPPISLPVASALTVTLRFADGTCTDVSQDERTVYRVVRGAGLVHVENGCVTAEGPSGAATIQVSAEHFMPMFSSSARVSTPVLQGEVRLVVVLVGGLELTATPFPAFPGSSDKAVVTLRRIHRTSAWQRATINATATLTDGTMYDVSEVASFTSKRPDIVAVAPPNMLVPSRAGVAVIAGQFAGEVKGYLMMRVDATLPATPVHVEARTVWWEGRTFLGEWGASKRLAVRVVFDDGTELPDAVGGAEWISTPQLLRFESGVEAAVAVDAHGVATLLGNHHRAVELTVTAACPEAEGLQMPQSVEQVYANLEPSIGDVDLGRRWGLQFPAAAHGEVVAVEVRVNSGAGALLEYDIEVQVDAAHLQVQGCVQGRDWAGAFQCTINAPPEIVLLHGRLLTAPVVIGEALHLATAEITVQGTPAVSLINGLVLSMSRTDSGDVRDVHRLGSLVFWWRGPLLALVRVPGALSGKPPLRSWGLTVMRSP